MSEMDGPEVGGVESHKISTNLPCRGKLTYKLSRHQFRSKPF